MKSSSDHEKVCQLYPMKCTNDCGQNGLVRKLLAQHRKDCKYEVIECHYAYVGCKEKRRREDLPQHLAINEGKHLELMTVAYEELNKKSNRFSRKPMLHSLQSKRLRQLESDTL